jgi:hypothetical protein
MGGRWVLWLPRGSPTPARRSFPKNRRIGDLRLPSCCSGKALCVKGLAVRQIAWYQRSAERSSQTSLSGSYTPGANLLIVCGEKSQGALSSLVQAHQSPEYLARLPNI